MAYSVLTDGLTRSSSICETRLGETPDAACELAKADPETLALRAEAMADLRGLESAVRARDGLVSGHGRASPAAMRPGTGQERVLERRAVRDRRVGRRDAPGVVEVAEAVLDDRGEHLARPAAGQRPLLDDDEPVRLLDRGEDGLGVERPQRAQVDHLDRDAVRVELGRGGEASCTPFIAVTSVTSLPSRTTAASPSRAGAPFDLALERVQALVLEEEHRVVVADRRLAAAPSRRRASTGATILMPGTPMNHDAGICEWIAPKRPPAPTTERIDERHADLLLRQEPVLRRLVDERCPSRACRKSPNMISITGRSPCTAEPNAAPASASSEIGVSKTRSAPYFS